MKVALVGQPNSGKSTVFNAVAGYRSLTSNFAGTTVEYTRGQACISGVSMDLIDLPGLYSLTPTSAVEEVSRDFLLQGDWDVLINVVDASQMARSLELTLELLDLEAPMVVCLNMMDEASRKGMTINTLALASALGVPVVEAIGGRGRGIVETFQAAQREAQSGRRPHPYVYAPELESVLDRLTPELESADDPPVLDAPQKTEIVISPAIAARENLGLPFATSARSTSNEHLPPLCSVKGCSSLCCSGLSGTTGKHGARPQSQGLGLSGRAPHSSSSLLGEAIDRDHGFSLFNPLPKFFLRRASGRCIWSRASPFQLQ